jgi:O-succinylbenzoic acid--CoA ligase
MSTKPWINLNGIIYNLDQVTSGSFKNDLSLFEQSTLTFCHDWLTGKQEFQLQTSGSTGAPKIITITRKQMEASADLTIKALKLKPDYTALVCLDTKYIAGQMMLVRCLAHGMNMVVVDPSSNPFDKIHSSLSIDFGAFVPYQLQSILNSSSSERLSKLKCAIIGGAPVDHITKKELQSLMCTFYATYGMTETISHVALQQLNGEQAQEYFEVLDGIKIGIDERGCLVIQASYLNPEKIITNDLVEIIDEKKFRWLGRWDNVINSGGVKIVPEKIELAVQEIFDSLKLPNQFFAAGLPDEKLNQKVALIVEGSSFPGNIQWKIEKELEEKIDRFERPKELKFISNFIRTENGKVKRSETLNLIPIRPQ